jgi:aminobenzoyl-glutamate utilization protein B
MVDQIFSFGELGFQEFETSRYLVDLLRREGFTVEEGFSGVPTAWVARWGTGKPVIALGSDIDGIPKASQMPGVACRRPMIAGAPGHGEGHNSGQAVNVTAALAVKRLMEREGLSGTLMLWPGVAEEQLGTKGFFARDGMFRDVDASFFTLSVPRWPRARYGSIVLRGTRSVRASVGGRCGPATTRRSSGWSSRVGTSTRPRETASPSRCTRPTWSCLI